MNKTILCFLCVAFFAITASAQTKAPTWGKDVQCIIYSHCSTCHNSNGIAPFSLITYQDAFINRVGIRNDVSIHKMPPYLPNTNYQHYTDMRVLSPQEINTIVAWVDSGSPQGDTTNLLPPPTFSAGPLITHPDITARIPTFTVPASGADLYQCFVITGPQDTAAYIKTLEVIPGTTAAVHHVLVYQDTAYTVKRLDSLSTTGPGYTNFGGTGSPTSTLIGAWVPGSGVDSMPNGMGIKLNAGARLILQIHYPVTAQGLIDSTRINIQFTNTSPIRTVDVNAALAYYLNLQNGPLVIPIDSTRTFYEKYRVPVDVTVLGVAPHAHLVCEKMQSFAVTPAGDTIHLIDIPKWDFHWQGGHMFQKPIKIPAGSELYGWGYYDNTLNNPESPRPLRTVTAGEATTNEMLLFFFWYLPYRSGDENIIIDTTTYKPTYMGCVSNWLPDSTSATGITNPVIGSNFMFYPNPAQTAIHFNSSNQVNAISLLDVTGKTVIDFAAPGNRGQLPVSTLVNGLYFIKVQNTDGTVETLRFIKY